MKKLLTATLVLCLISMNVFASFPVKKDKVSDANVELEQKTTTIQLEDASIDLGANLTVGAEDALSPAVAGSGGDSFIVTLLLWFFLGGLAAHRWYKKKPAGWNILFILTLGGLGLWWLIDGIMILTDSF